RPGHALFRREIARRHGHRLGARSGFLRRPERGEPRPGEHHEAPIRILVDIGLQLGGVPAVAHGFPEADLIRRRVLSERGPGGEEECDAEQADAFHFTWYDWSSRSKCASIGGMSPTVSRLWYFTARPT